MNISDVEDVYAYLGNHRNHLDEYIMKYVQIGDVAKWYKEKLKLENQAFDESTQYFYIKIIALTSCYFLIVTYKLY